MPGSLTRLRHAPLIGGIAVAVVVVAALQIARADEYWDFTEGVNLMSARQLADGTNLYSGLIAAQPPLVFLFGALIASVSDSLEASRFVLSGWQLLGSALGAVVVLRLTGSRAASFAAVPLGVLMPWTTRELGILIPEVVAAPLLLGSILLASRASTATLAGLVLALLATLKWPFLLVALAVCAAAEDRRRCALALAGGLATLGVTYGLVFGLEDIWRQTVVAQAQVGLQPGEFPGYVVQAAWNLGPLVVGAAAALLYRSESGDPGLGRVLTAAAAASLALAASTIKLGTSLNVLVLAEAVLLPAAICGAVWSVRVARGIGERRRVSALVATAVMGGLLLAQSGSLLASPQDPRPFTRPLSRVASEVTLSEAQVHAAVREARACPRDLPYSGPPFVAFLADRSMPAGQPDQFILQHAEEHRDLLRHGQAERSCPR